MSAATVFEQSAADAPVTRERRSLLRSLLAHPVAVVCLVFLGSVTVLGILSPLLPLPDPRFADLSAVNSPSSGSHLLGTDDTGRDILSRLMWGTQGTVLACVIVLASSVFFGVTSGLIAGYYRGRFEAIADFVSDLIMTLPGIVLLISLYTLTGPNIPVAMAFFGLLIAPSYFRLVRGIVLAIRGELYVDAAKVAGLSDLRIVGRHVLSGVRSPVIIVSAGVLAAGIGIQVGLDFIGLGNREQPSWGGVLQESFSNIYNNPTGVLWPALLIGFTILALGLLGNALSDVLQAHSRVKLLPRRRVARIRRGLDADESRSGELPTPAGDVLLSLRGLRIGYPNAEGDVTEVVHGVNLDVRRGEIHGLVGESGSGKSQIAFTVLGILPKEAVLLGGQVVLDGVDLLSDDALIKAARGRRIAYVPQEPMSNLDPSFTIGSQLRRRLRSVTRMSKREADQHLLGLLKRVGISDAERVFKSYPYELSGGMAQRVLICGALAADPDIIVADEPTTALDVTVQAGVLQLLRELRDERGLAMILVTHNLGVVADLCDTVSVMKEGRIVERRGVEELFASPAEPYTQDLLASSRAVELEEAL